MTRLGLAVLVAAALGVAPLAWAATPQPARPEIVAADRTVAFGESAVIRGRAGSPDGSVTLQRYRDGRWIDVAAKPVNGGPMVRFRLAGRRTSATYRLATSDAASDPVRIRVRADLSLEVAPKHGIAGSGVRVRGRLRPSISGRKVRIQRRGRRGWTTIGKQRVRDGRYAGRVVLRRAGGTRVRAVWAGDAHNAADRVARSVFAYDSDPATWYGPGLYGNGTACGGTLGPGTLGVAHRTLPCGTVVHLLYRGRTVSVRVIDRGPYGSAEWDLTEATARRLHFEAGSVGTRAKR
jgi:rare lipoprotein A